MDDDLRFWLSILLYFVIFPVFGLFLLNKWSKKHREKSKTLLSKAKLELEQSQSSEPSFICYGADDIDGSLVQFHGSPHRTALRPGMKLTVLGIEYPIKEVYANDDSPEKPDAQIPEGGEDVAIVVEAPGFDIKGLYQQLKEKSVLVFNVT